MTLTIRNCLREHGLNTRQLNLFLPQEAGAADAKVRCIIRYSTLRGVCAVRGSEREYTQKCVPCPPGLFKTHRSVTNDRPIVAVILAQLSELPETDSHSDPVRDPFAIHLTCVLLRNDIVFVPRVFPRPSPGRRMLNRE